MYSQIYTKKADSTGIVTFPNHSAIEQMKSRNYQESHSKNIREPEIKCTKDCCTDEILLLAAMLAFGSSNIDSDLFTLIAAAIICA